jgi:hypothetical protein
MLDSFGDAGVFGLEVWWLFIKNTIPFKHKPHL